MPHLTALGMKTQIGRVIFLKWHYWRKKNPMTFQGQSKNPGCLTTNPLEFVFLPTIK